MRALRITFIALLVLAVLALAATPAAALIDPPFFQAGDCEYAALSVHAWHEFGHDIASLAVGERPLNPGSLWGDKWTNTHPRFQRIAIGGLVAQLILAAFHAAIEEPEPACSPAMNTIGATMYAARARLAPDFAGDYDPFTPRGRGLVGVGSVVTSLLLEALAEHRVHASLFAGERPQVRLVQVPLAEPAVARRPGGTGPILATAVQRTPAAPVSFPAATPLPPPADVLPLLTLFPDLPPALPHVTPSGLIEARELSGDRAAGPVIELPEAPLGRADDFPAVLPRDVGR